MGLLASDGDMPSTKRLTTYLATLVFAVSSVSLYGDASIMAFGYDLVTFLSTPLIDTGTGIVVSYAHALSIMSVVGVYYGASHPETFSDFTDQQGSLAIGTTVAVLLTAISPELTSFVTATNSRALAFTAFLLLGWVAIIESNEINEAMGR